MSTPTEARAHFTNWITDLRQNAFDADPHFVNWSTTHHPELIGSLRDFGGEVSTTLDRLAKENNRDANLPRLRRWNSIGQNTESIEFHPYYDDIGRSAYSTGIMSRYEFVGKESESLSFLYLLAQNGEAGHCCPMACTAGMLKIVRGNEAFPADWRQRLLDPNYDTHFHGSQFLTEIQGGSDVGSNTLEARQTGSGWELTGEKWFCSVADAHLYLVTGRPEGEEPGTRGLKAFVVPRNQEDGTVNGISLRRLKDKLGTRSMASAEIDFSDASAVEVGDFRRVVQIVLNTSRLYNAVCSSAMIQRAYREAESYARHRIAFGNPILAFPAVARIVARLKTESVAARSLTFRLALLGDKQDRGEGSETEAAALRMLVSLNKYWTSVSCTLAIRDAIEVLGGNGTIEEFSILPRLLRDSIVCEAWEGGHNVLCAQSLKDSVRLGLHEHMFDWLEGLTGARPRLTRVRTRWNELIAADPEFASSNIRVLIDELRPVAQSISIRAEKGESPLLRVLDEHLRVTTERGYDPLRDTKMNERVKALVAN